ncbi:MAG: TIM barrel protein, partial [Planctomycetota bacterium]|nr:TIM barrel protein [Planctomycetota bacterium]
MKLAISQVCSLHAQLPQCIEDYSAGTCPAIEVWLPALEYYLDQSSPEELRALLDAQGMSIPAASYQGGLLVSQGEERQVAWELFRRRLKLCRELLIPTLVVAADVPSPIRSGDMERVQVSLRQAAHEAAEHDICIALELQSGSAFGNNLQSVSALVDQTQHPNLG